jgi:hypothetical protein
MQFGLGTALIPKQSEWKVRGSVSGNFSSIFLKTKSTCHDFIPKFQKGINEMADCKNSSD